jgi:hypothetical protein
MRIEEIVWNQYREFGIEFADLIDDCDDLPDFIDLEHTEEWERSVSHVAN